VPERRIGDRQIQVPLVDLRPQSVLLAFFGDYVSGQNEAVAAASVIGVLETAGVGSYATRATLTRMVKRGLLRRIAVGRQAFFGLTDFGRRTVLTGKERAQVADVMDRRWDGRWTLVAFSLPEDSQRERHELRSRLSWAGFGMVQAGLWAAPHNVDLVDLLSDLDALRFVNAFSGEPLAPTEAARLVESSFDLATLSARYEGFLQRWEHVERAGAQEVADPLTARVLLSADWLLVLRHDPRLPLEFLPDRWPGLSARLLHHSLEARLREPAEREARRRLDVRVVEADGSRGVPG
jgi:phenylacetic acid degradation operon negative regulatory protein